MKILKLKALTILGLVMITALVATTFAVYSYAAPTQTRAVNEEYGEKHGEHHEMHNHWEGMHNETEEPHHHHHGCP